MIKQLLIIFFGILPMINGQDNRTIEQIDREVKAIKTNLDSLHKDSLIVYTLSMDGTEVVRYRDKNNQIKLLTLWYDGELGKSYEEYYFQNSELIFALTKFYDDYTESDSMEIVYDFTSLLAEDVYYFANNKLVRWIKNKEYSVDPHSREYFSLERNMKINLQAILDEIKNK